MHGVISLPDATSYDKLYYIASSKMLFNLKWTNQVCFCYAICRTKHLNVLFLYGSIMKQNIEMTQEHAKLQCIQKIIIKSHGEVHTMFLYTVTLEIFKRVLFSRNFAYSKCRENKTLAK